MSLASRAFNFARKTILTVFKSDERLWFPPVAGALNTFTIGADFATGAQRDAAIDQPSALASQSGMTVFHVEKALIPYPLRPATTFLSGPPSTANPSLPDVARCIKYKIDEVQTASYLTHYRILATRH